MTSGGSSSKGRAMEHRHQEEEQKRDFLANICFLTTKKSPSECEEVLVSEPTALQTLSSIGGRENHSEAEAPEGISPQEQHTLLCQQAPVTP